MGMLKMLGKSVASMTTLIIPNRMYICIIYNLC